MADHFLTINGSPCIITRPNIHRYLGLTFEWHNYCGPMRLKKDGEPSKRNFGRKSWPIIDKWVKLPPSKKKRTLIFS